MLHRSCCGRRKTKVLQSCPDDGNHCLSQADVFSPPLKNTANKKGRTLCCFSVPCIIKCLNLNYGTTGLCDEKQIYKTSNITPDLTLTNTFMCNCLESQSSQQRCYSLQVSNFAMFSQGHLLDINRG